jgi:hypothetical protein
MDSQKTIFMQRIFKVFQGMSNHYFFAIFQTKGCIIYISPKHNYFIGANGFMGFLIDFLRWAKKSECVLCSYYHL